MNEAQPAEIFDPKRLRAKIDRATTRSSADRFLWDQMAADIAERLTYISRSFDRVLLIGPAADYQDIILGERKAEVTTAQFSPALAAATGAALIEGEILPFQSEDFDLVICFGILDRINDLPGFLFQLRHILRPDGLFLGSAFGAGSLSTLKATMLRAEGDRAAPHIHPQIDLHNMSQLVVRAGFALPVVDQDQLQVRYSSLNALLSDLRNMGLGNIMIGARRYFGKTAYRDLHRLWAGQAGTDGKSLEYYNFLHINGWAPSPDQPKPARRGSGQQSLADILESKDGER